MASPVEPSRTRPRTPFLARKMLCSVCAWTSTAAWSDLESAAGLKKVGTGTKTPFGGEVTVEVIMWLVRGVVWMTGEHDFRLDLQNRYKKFSTVQERIWAHHDFIASAAARQFGALCSRHRS